MLEALQAAAAHHKARGKLIVFTNGCFDLLHRGHLHLLREAKKLGDVLVVAINSDRSIQRIKGPHRPICSEGERAELLAALEMVDFVTIFSEADPSRIIQQLRPQVLVKGGDWLRDRIVGREIVEADGGKVVTIPLLSGYSTTEIVQRIRQEESWQESVPSAAKEDP